MRRMSAKMRRSSSNDAVPASSISRRLRIVENRFERLVELVRDRARDLADRRPPIQVRDRHELRLRFRQPLPESLLGTAPLAMLAEQPHQQQRLHAGHRQGRDDDDGSRERHDRVPPIRTGASARIRGRARHAATGPHVWS